MGAIFERETHDTDVGDAALAAVKVANAVAHKQAAYDMELAKHATHAALEMDNTRRLVERYILGNDVLTISDVEPLAGQVEGGGPPNYSAFPYPLESEGWPTNYPVPEPPTLDKVYLLPEKTKIAWAPLLVANPASPPSEPRRERLGAHFL
ncbi:unnamed protein product [Cladocopium goreaui]|uniref:(+)-neomenthol dehydrogenase n=1 Tax=Cladocopium goreaui TaxID=2562237 RepID=A0A9P1FHE8_9DINO|nr:unnamed protein product [Cladocopium goreaui]